VKIAINAPPTKPSKPYMTDEYVPTNPTVWERVLEVARGDRRQMTLNDRTIHAPNHGRGFKHWPNPKAIAWAVKQYNGYNGGWKRNQPREASLLVQAGLSGILATKTAEEHARAEVLQEHDLLKFDHEQGPWRYWTTTYKGARLVRASLGEELRRMMDDLIHHFDVEAARDIAGWIEKNFRVDSPKTPKGGKELKEKLKGLVWVMKHRASQSQGSPEEIAEKVRKEVEANWVEIKPHIAQLVAGFTDEGGKVVPKEVSVDGVTYKNEVGADEVTLDKYVKRLSTIFHSVKGWQARAMKGGLTVVLASPRDFRGTSTGKYRTAEDALYIRATPAVLKRDAGYASFEYILVHELGHRFERFNSLPKDFDKPEWWTTKYSRTEGEGFAELFALSHFGYTGTWDKAIVERFDSLMA